MCKYRQMNEDQKHDEIIEFFNSPEMKEIIDKPDVNLVVSHAVIFWPNMSLVELCRIMNRLVDEDEMTGYGQFNVSEVLA